MEYPPNFYPLTSLQIGNVRGYPSSSYLYSAPESKKLLILVDHGPSSESECSTRTDPEQSEISNGNHNQTSAIGASRIFQKSCAIFDAAKSRTKHLLSVDDLGKIRHGLLVFEVAWKDVCGIKYQNDLLTDASFALEVKSMVNWEFNAPHRASRYVSSWFSGTDSEVRRLKDCLGWIISSGRTDSSESVPGVPKEIGDEQESSSGTDDRCQQDENNATKCGHTFVLFRFGDENNNPSADLRKTILDDARLLRLLESGLPSWAIFFQSYPLFSHCYRPWLRHLVRTIHGLILFISFVIGFYDLYRNIPLMKADLSRISGFLCQWMESCETIISQNLEMAVRWFLQTARPLVEPLASAGFGMFLAPLWKKCAGTAEVIASVLSYAIASLYQLIGFLINRPREIVSSSMRKTAALIRLIFTAGWEVLPKLRICGPLFGWLEAGEMLRFPYLGMMLLIQNFEKAVRWLLGTVRLLAETLAAAGVGKLLGCVRKICAGTAEVVSWGISSAIEPLYDPFLDMIKAIFELISSGIDEIATSIQEILIFAWEVLRPIQLVLSRLKRAASAARAGSPDLTNLWELRRPLLELLPSFSAGGRGYRFRISIWTDLRSEFLSLKALGNVKTVASGLSTFFIPRNPSRPRERDTARGSQRRRPTESSPSPRARSCRHSQEHCDRCEQEPEPLHR